MSNLFLTCFLTSTFLISSIKLNFKEPTGVINSYNPSDLKILYKSLFTSFKAVEEDDLSDCCSYGYVRPNDSQYFEGFSGIFQYANYSHQGVSDLLSKKGISISSSSNSGFYSIEHYEKLAGMNLFMSNNSNGGYVPWEDYKPYDFEHYNPKFIKWATKNLIPSSKFSINNITVQYVYKHYSRFFRLLMESYLFLKSSGKYNESANSYIESLKSAYEQGIELDGLDYLRNHFGETILKKYEVTNKNIPSPFDASMAIGFWLRRNLDGTHDDFYKGLSVIMNRFDKKWFKKIRKSY